MRTRPSRRGFLTAVGAGSFALAGCTGLSGVGGPDGRDGTPTSTETESPTTEQPTESPTATPQSSGPGTVVEDFEELDAWESVGGTFTADEQNAFTDGQSVRIENSEGGVAGIEKRYAEGLDLTGDTLSIAVKLEEPAAGKLAVELLAPYRGDSLVSKRYLVEELDDWVRVDLGYTGSEGDPDLSNVERLRIMVVTQDEPVRFWVDDLRKSPSPDRGKVMLTFDNAHVSQYDNAFPELQDRGWPGVAAVNPGAVGTQDNLTIGQLREMRDAGWDVSSHPMGGEPLTAASKEEQRQELEAAKSWLEQRGFDDGARFFFAPYDSVNGATLEVVEELHEYGFTFGGCPNGAPPAGTNAISQVYGRDVDGVKELVDLASSHGQLVVLNYGAIGEEHDVTPATLGDVLDHVGSKDVDVVTPSQLLEMG